MKFSRKIEQHQRFLEMGAIPHRPITNQEVYNEVKRLENNLSFYRTVALVQAVIALILFGITVAQAQDPTIFKLDSFCSTNQWKNGGWSAWEDYSGILSIKDDEATITHSGSERKYYIFENDDDDNNKSLNVYSGAVDWEGDKCMLRLELRKDTNELYFYIYYDTGYALCYHIKGG